jgi:hypothetical protein
MSGPTFVSNEEQVLLYKGEIVEIEHFVIRESSMPQPAQVAASSIPRRQDYQPPGRSRHKKGKR